MVVLGEHAEAVSSVMAKSLFMIQPWIVLILDLVHE